MMAQSKLRRAVQALALVLAAVTVSFSDPALMRDLDILTRAIAKSLGEKSNSGVNRIKTIDKHEDQGKDILQVVLNAKSNPTPAGLRHGILADTAQVLEIVKSWGWPEKVDRIIIKEYSPLESGNLSPDAQLVFTGAISSSKVQETDWRAIDWREVPKTLDESRWHRSLD